MTAYSVSSASVGLEDSATKTPSVLQLIVLWGLMDNNYINKYMYCTSVDDEYHGEELRMIKRGRKYRRLGGCYFV